MALTTTIRDDQRGLLIEDGQVIRWLEPGRYSWWNLGNALSVEILPLDGGYRSFSPDLKKVMPAGAAEEVFIEPGQIGIFSLDKQPKCYLAPGRYFLWKLRTETKIEIFSTATTFLEIPETYLSLLPTASISTVTIAENQRGFLLDKGQFRRWLEPGRYSWWNQGKTLEIRAFSIEAGYAAFNREWQKILPEGAAEEVFIPAGHIGIFSLEKQPTTFLAPGRYFLWKFRNETKVEIFSILPTFPEIPEPYWSLIPTTYAQAYTVLPYQRLLLYVNGTLEKELEAGRVLVGVLNRQISATYVDVREQEIQIVGQEVMTFDKVTLRLNLIIKYRITDATKSQHNVQNLFNSIYSDAQMSARKYIAGYTVDQLLESRNEAARQMSDELSPRALDWGVEILRIDVKDIVLPGEMKALLNRVIEAEKEAAANLILRREETAATRSLANTAKMLEKNPTLLRLKELEAWKEIAGKIKQLTLVTSGSDLLQRLSLPAASSAPTVDAPEDK